MARWLTRRNKKYRSGSLLLHYVLVTMQYLPVLTSTVVVTISTATITILTATVLAVRTVVVGGEERGGRARGRTRTER